MDFQSLNSFEALCSRFSRVSNILVNKVFCMLDLIEIKTEDTITHEYRKEDLESIYLEVMVFTPKLIEAFYKSEKYFAELVKKLNQ